MICNGASGSEDDTIICLDTSQDSSLDDADEDDTSSVNQITLEKTLPPGIAPDGFIILDESIEQNADDNNEFVVEEKATPMFKVIFKDERARIYQDHIKDFFQKLVTVNSIDNDSDCSEYVMNIWAQPHADAIEKAYNDPKNTNNILFMIDNIPGGEDMYNVPTYGTKFEKVLKRSHNNLENDEKNDAAPKVNCFNCLGDHNLRDCSEPRNPFEINKNRKMFTVRTTPRNVRYHVDDEQKFKPGVLSPELRNALGLADNQLPKHIFKMRLIGYPPGWLEEAKLEHSGLNLYNSEGSRELDPTEEAGEIFSPENKTQYDINKLHDFPGFNVPAPPGTQDAYWSPDQQLFHSKETMLSMLSCRKTDDGYKRKKLQMSIDQSSPNVTAEVAEMDVEPSEDGLVEEASENGNFTLPLPIDTVEPLPPGCEQLSSPFPKLITAETSEIVSRTNSPSLSDLESRKKLLLEALDDSNSQSNPGTPIRAAAQPIMETPKSSNISTPQSPLVQSSSIENTPNHGKIKSVELGTPILKSASVYTNLPSSDKFSKDICDVINFENLPDATGKYEKLSGLLLKIRELSDNTKDN